MLIVFFDNKIHYLNDYQGTQWTLFQTRRENSKLRKQSNFCVLSWNYIWCKSLTVSKPIWTAKSRCEPNSNESRAQFTICPNDTPWRQAPYTFLKLYLSDIFKNIWKNTCRANQGKTSIKVLRRRLRITVNQMVKCIGCQKIWIFRNRIKLEVTKLISFWLTSSSSILTS